MNFDEWWAAAPVSEFVGVTAEHVEKAWIAGRKSAIEEMLPKERECCGTFPGTTHRATCDKYRGKAWTPSSAEIVRLDAAGVQPERMES